MTVLRAACLDLWGTLIADPPGAGEARARERVIRLVAALRDAGWGAPAGAVADAVQATIDSMVTLHQSNSDVDAVERLTLFLRHLDPSLQPERDLSESQRESIRAALQDGAVYAPPALLPGALETVQALRAAGLRLALVSNVGLSPGASVRSLLGTLGLARHFSAQIYSDEVLAWKPHARMFDEAVFALGVAPEEVAFVGDTPEADIVGAQAFGLGVTALVGGKRVDGIRPTYELAGIADLVAALGCDGHLAPAG